MTCTKSRRMNISSKGIIRVCLMQIKCADCGCLPSECKASPSPSQCPNCTWQECWLLLLRCSASLVIIIIIISAVTQSRLLFFHHGILLELSANYKGDSRTPNESGTPIEPQIAKDTREQRRRQRPCRVHRCARYEG